MAEGLSWKDIELHADNLVPGLLLSAELLATGIPVPAGLAGHSAFVGGAIFVAASYALGLLGALVGRQVLDWVSENGLRAWVFERLVHGKRADLLNYYQQRDAKFRIDLENERKRRRKEIGEWNAIYRSALRCVPEQKQPEVARRRAQGRLTRSLCWPVAIGIGITIHAATGFVVLGILAALVGLPILAYLYAYAELNNMAEAYDISAFLQVQPPQDSKRIDRKPGNHSAQPDHITPDLGQAEEQGGQPEH